MFREYGREGNAVSIDARQIWAPSYEAFVHVQTRLGLRRRICSIAASTADTAG